jgi:two-component system sensor histidine kinase CpxA
MKLRVPLYAKILVWFFLNVILLGVSFLIFAAVQFHFGLDVLVAGPAAERLQAVVQLLLPELNEKPRDEWNAVLKTYNDAYHVKFYLFRNDIANPEQVAGDQVVIPQAVRGRIMEHRPAGAPPGGPGRRGGPPGAINPEGFPQDQPERGQLPPDGGQLPPRAGQPPRGPAEPPQRFLVHTSDPSRYWVVVPFRLHGLDPQRPMLPAALLIESDTLSAGGLFFEWEPWLVAGVCVVVISALFWFPLVRGITSSISQMTEATESIAEGQFDVRTRVQRQDELGSLSEAINRMGTRLSGFVTGQKRFSAISRTNFVRPSLACKSRSESLNIASGTPRKSVSRTCARKSSTCPNW